MTVDCHSTSLTVSLLVVEPTVLSGVSCAFTMLVLAATIKATQGVNVGGFLTSAVFDTGEGNGGSITIDTSTL
ncbi:MAG: hypothetical protein ACKPEQ_30960, partial [Dolichospermum sp.]